MRGGEAESGTAAAAPSAQSVLFEVEVNRHTWSYSDLPALVRDQSSLQWLYPEQPKELVAQRLQQALSAG